MRLLGGRRASRELRRTQGRMEALQRRVALLELERGGLQRILDSMDEAVLAVDRSGIVLHVNEAAAALFGFDPARVTGSHMVTVIPEPVVCEALEAVMRGSDAATQRRQLELTLDATGGDTRQVRVDVTPLRELEPSADHATEGAIAVLQDVTTVRRLERARTDFFTNVSHELKTPITAIRGVVETMIDDPQMEAHDTRRFLATLQRQSRRLAELVRDLLSLARLESEGEQLERTPVDLAAVVDAAVDAVSDAAAAGGVDIRVDVAPAGAVVAGDRESLVVAVENLLGNAVRYAGDDNHVHVRVGVDGTDAHVDVVDHGPGIAPEHHQRIFERFYRVDPARSRERGGTGVGLSIVKHTALLHGGSVEVVSAPRAGSTFRLLLPLLEPDDGAAAVNGARG